MNQSVYRMYSLYVFKLWRWVGSISEGILISYESNNMSYLDLTSLFPNSSLSIFDLNVYELW